LRPQPQIDNETQLAIDIANFYADPLGYVRYAFPWGVKSTVLAQEDGPDVWQEEELRAIGEQVVEAEKAIKEGREVASIRRAVSSGHGVGKTAYTSWVIKWFMATRVNPN